MADSDLEPGDVIRVAIPRHVPPGPEQEGTRPVVVVGRPDSVGIPRFPLVVVVPLTSQYGSWADRSPHLYPHLAGGTAGLPNDSVALLDQVRSVDADRIQGYLGTLTRAEYAPFRTGLQQIFDGSQEEEAEAPEETG